MPRTPIFVANWKMNKTNSEAIAFITDFLPKVATHTSKIVIAPPATALSDIYKLTQKTKIKLASQSIFYENNGSFTGEISAEMAKQFCSYVLIGHSERRHLFGETDKDVNKKIHSALAQKLKPILCIGETKEQKDAGKTEKVLNMQLTSGLKDVNSEQIKQITFAYEPVWAISKGQQDTNTKPATPEDAQKAHAFIRGWISQNYNNEVAKNTKIAYGGSAKPENASELMKQKDIDGLLVGAASLDAEKFIKIITC
ncbi:MAG: triose-phosphate isomerase [Candidatus Diapherotrites archaeon]